MKTRFLHSVALCLLCLLACFAPAQADNPLGIPDTEYNALVALYNATDGPNWTNNTNWLTDNTPWFGVEVQNGHVERIDLYLNNLAGYLPAELGNLSNLQVLILRGNELLSGAIPAQLGNLSNLWYLDLGGNQLTGPIPSELGNLSNLQCLDLQRNQLRESIPPELGGLSNLQVLILCYNQLSGAIPPELGNLSSLQTLYLWDNQLSGSIPPEMGNLSSLQRLELYGNQLSGSIPPEMGNLSNLQRLELYGNQLSGSIPPELGNLSNLGVLHLGRNQLSGSIPPELGNLSNLGGLYLDGNHLTGPIPLELGDLSSLCDLFLQDNHLTGPIPEELGNLTWLWYLYLGDNRLSGPIPAALGNLTSLKSCFLRGNMLSGEIPASVVNLTNLYSLQMHHNCLSSSDAAVKAFLEPISGAWESTQTVPPADARALRELDGDVLVSWATIEYQWDEGYYEVGCSQTPGGPYTFNPAHRTSSKYDSDLWLTGLDPGQPVYLVVRTVTLAHSSNQSTLVSEPSEEIAPQALQRLSKMLPDGTPVWCGDAVITAVSSSSCYVESRDRTWGIEAENADGVGGFPDPGTAVEFCGVLRTGYDGERYVEVIDGFETGTADIAPLGLTSRALGGGDFHFDGDTGAGQRGVTGGAGLNNIGLLVKTCGTVTYLNSDMFALTDGSGATVICCSSSDTILVNPAWQQVAVTGISSIWKTDESYERVLYITDVQPVNSAPNQGVTGRWEMTSTSGTWAGVHGMLLVQEGTSVTGRIAGSWLYGGQMNGQTLTCECYLPGYGVQAQVSLVLDGDTLSGTWTVPGRTWDVEFHRVSPDPISPHVGRPKLLSATCSGSFIDVVWDRPISGYDFRIADSDGQTVAESADEELRYDPATYTYRIILESSVILDANARYTVYLESDDWSGVNWHDPYGIAAWDWEGNAYSFEFVYRPPAPGSKIATDGDVVAFTDVVITATFPDCCYIANEERTLGLRVQDPNGEAGDFPDPGTRVFCYGTMRTNEHGERYLEVADGDETGSGSVGPVTMKLRALGGGDFHFNGDTGAGQRGVTGGLGVNNIGLLVKVAGACTYVDPHTFTVDDGSGVEVTCVTPPTILASTAWQQVVVTGISSIRESDGTYERLLRVTAVDPVVAAPPDGITGRWEATDLTMGVFGMLLVQQQSAVIGTSIGLSITDGQMSGSVFTGSFYIAQYDKTADFSLTLSGDTLAGTWIMNGDDGPETMPLTFIRVSPHPISPYIGRPKVLSATCDGHYIDIGWDRPIFGMDYDIIGPDGVSIRISDLDTSYEPGTLTYHIALPATMPFVAGATYTIRLEEEDGTDWHDPYGVGAWQGDDDCYTFTYIHDGGPPPPPL